MRDRAPHRNAIRFRGRRRTQSDHAHVRDCPGVAFSAPARAVRRIVERKVAGSNFNDYRRPSLRSDRPRGHGPAPRWWERLSWYTGSMILTCVLVFFGLRLDRVDPTRAVLLRSRFPADDADGQGHRRTRTGGPLAQRAPGRGSLPARFATTDGSERLPGHRSVALLSHLALKQAHYAFRGALQRVLSAHVPAHHAHGDDRVPPSAAHAPRGGGRRNALLVSPVPLPTMGEPLFARGILARASLASPGPRNLPGNAPVLPAGAGRDVSSLPLELASDQSRHPRRRGRVGRRVLRVLHLRADGVRRGSMRGWCTERGAPLPRPAE